MTNFGYDGNADSTLTGWAPRLRSLVQRITGLESFQGLWKASPRVEEPKARDILSYDERDGLWRNKPFDDEVDEWWFNNEATLFGGEFSDTGLTTNDLWQFDGGLWVPKNINEILTSLSDYTDFASSAVVGVASPQTVDSSSVAYARYKLIGTVCHYFGEFSVDPSAATAFNTITLPITAAHGLVCSAIGNPITSGTTQLLCSFINGSLIRFYPGSQTTGSTWANASRTVYFNILYRI